MADPRTASYDALAMTWDDDLDPAARWRQVCRQVVAECAQTAPQDVLLDLGCGTGTLGVTLAPYVARVIGVDLSGRMLDVARAKAAAAGVGAKCRWDRTDLVELPAERDLSVITCCWALHHLDEPRRKRLWAQAHARLPKMGQLIVGGLIPSMDPAVIDGVEDWITPTDVLPGVNRVGNELREAGFAPTVDIVHPAVAVFTAIRT
jgi:cyclopropane fatty-acyl-phospholipid synthase-like methyltransferase